VPMDGTSRASSSVEMLDLTDWLIAFLCDSAAGDTTNEDAPKDVEQNEDKPQQEAATDKPADK